VVYVFRDGPARQTFSGEWIDAAPTARVVTDAGPRTWTRMMRRPGHSLSIATTSWAVRPGRSRGLMRGSRMPVHWGASRCARHRRRPTSYRTHHDL